MAGGPTRPRTGIGAGATTLAWVVLAVGVALSTTIGILWARSVEERNEQSFAAVTTNVQAAVSTAVQRQDDLLATVQGMIDSDPELTNREFRDWYDAADVEDRLPSGFGVGYIERVPEDELDAFTAEVTADPPVVDPPAPPLALFPSTGAEVVCLQRLTVWKGGEVKGLQVSPGFDLCAREIPGVGPSIVPDVLEQATSSGEPALVPPADFVDGVIAVFAPIYAGGETPTTDAGREATVEGWVGATFTSDLFLAGTAVDGSTAVEVEHLSTSGWTTVVAGGTVDEGADTAVLPVSDDGNWRVEVRSTVGASSVPPRVQGLLILVAGSIISGLMFVVVRLLAGSRRRALDVARTSTQELHHLAMHDELTGLANRTMVLQRAELMIRQARNHRSDLAVLFLDLDDFKALNDTFGHIAGDAYLRAVADRLRGAVRATDLVGRIGGDEFVVLVESPSELGGVDLIASRLLEAVAHPVEVQGVVMPVSCSIGIAVGSQSSAGELLREADLAMYRAKSDGKGRVAHFEPIMLEELQDRIQLEWDLRSVLARDELRLRFQPVIDLASGAVTEVEALVRWLHPTRGLVPPDRFIPAAERTGQIVPIGRWVLQEACREAARWRANGTPVPVAVNLSVRQLEDDFLDDIEGALSDTGLSPSDLVVEVTETALMRDVEATERRLRALEGLGVRIAIDDFGTGYSSMAYLQRFPFHQLKIDRRFVAGLPGSAQADALIRTLIQLAQTLGLETVAEGVEDVPQHHRLLDLGCDSAQGFLYSRPVDPSQVPALLTTRGVALRRGLRVPSTSSDLRLPPASPMAN